jgi:FkbM family methyltransferase
MRPRKLLASVMDRMLRRMRFQDALDLADTALRAQGFGSGAGICESGELCVFDRIRTETPLLLDVGSHIGGYTEAFLRRFARGRSLLIEPSPAHIAEARRRLAQRPVEYRQYALSDTAGHATLYKTAVISGLASLAKRDLRHVGKEMVIEETVETRTLDDVVAAEGIARIDLLKLDVEGFELAVLRGGLRTIETATDLVQFEFGGCNLDTRTTLRDFFNLFGDLGFTLHVVRPRGDLVPLPRYREIYEQYRTTNFVAIRV